jgi:tripartite-type tricarboxylate transporter receptor subunit TctC
VRSGRLRALAVPSANRSAVVPNLPTIISADVAKWSKVVAASGAKID